MDGAEGTAAEAAVKEKKPRGQGIGKRAVGLIREGKPNAEVLAVLRAEFPAAKTSMSSVNWYRNNLRSKGETVPSARVAKPPKEKKERKAKPAKDAADHLA